MPIKPQYAEKLLSGEKHFEFRRKTFGQHVTHIVVYASSPVKQILGIVEIKQIHRDTPSATWQKTFETAGIAKSDFFAYFAGVDTAYAIEIKQRTKIRLKNAVSPKSIREDFRVPQFFTYVSEQFLNSVKEAGL